MNSKKSIVAFIDILGFKKLIENYFNGSDKHSLDHLTEALKNAEDFAIKFNKLSLKKIKLHLSFKQFSDCVSISMPYSEKHSLLTTCGALINVVRIYQYILLDHNIPTRGGISFGGHFENENMIFSESLVKAYLLETKKAIYPRVLIDKKLLCSIDEYLAKNPNEYEYFYKINGHVFIKDWDDEVFISPFGIVKEIEELVKLLGVSEVKKMMSSGIHIFDKDLAIPDNFMDQIEDDNYILKSALEKTNLALENNISLEHPDVALKYKWLKQFILWNLNPRKARIKFEPYFKKMP